MYRMLITIGVGLIVFGCTKPFTGATPYIEAKTIDEYLKTKSLTYPACGKFKKGYKREHIYLADESNLTYSCFRDMIREVIRNNKYPFVEFTKEYYSDSYRLKESYVQVGKMDIGIRRKYDKDGNLTSQKIYKQKSHLSYKDILEVLEKNGYLDLDNSKQLIGNFGFELSYFEKSKKWEFYTNIQPNYSQINRSLYIDDRDGSLIEYFDIIKPDNSELQGLTPGKNYNWVEEHKVYKK